MNAVRVLALCRVACLVAPLWLACAAGSPQAMAQSRAGAASPRARPLPAAIGAQNADRLEKRFEALAGGFGRAVAVSRSVGLVAAASGSPVRFYELENGKPAGEVHGCADLLRGGLGFHDGVLVVACESKLEIYHPRKRMRLQAPEIHSTRGTAVAFAWPRVAMAHWDGVLRIYSLTGAPHVEIPVPGPPIDAKSVALTADGSRVAVAWIQGSVWWWDTSRPAEPHRLVRHANESDSLAWSADGRLLAEEGELAFTTVWSVTGEPSAVAKMKNGDWVKRLLFTRDGQWLVRGGSDGLELAEIAGPKRFALDTRGQVEDVALDEVGASLAAIDRDGRVSLWAAR